MANMAVTQLGHIVVCVHNAEAPSPVEWARYLSATKAAAGTVGNDYSRIRTIVFTDGGGPNAVQRGQVNDLIGGKPSPGAIITESVMVRGIVTALSWFNPAIRAFPPSGMNAALEHLGLGPQDLGRILATLKELRSEFTTVKILSNVALA